jgi:hypothetical protein
MDEGVTFKDMYYAIRESEERKSNTVNRNWDELITTVHQDLLGRDPDESALDYWRSALSDGLQFEQMYLAISRCDERMVLPDFDWKPLIEAVHRDLLSRPADDKALLYWSEELKGGLRFEDLYQAIRDSSERQEAAPLWVYPGHYYSPVTSPRLLEADKGNVFRKDKNINNIKINELGQLKLIKAIGSHYYKLPFDAGPKENLRYYYNNMFFSYGDAVVLSCFMQEFRPKRIIEVGSGYSSAVILDTLDFTPGLETDCIFIEPYTERLDSLLKESDLGRAKILPNFVQDVDIELFESLSRNDILFIDSTHVVKTGSDVLYHIQNILPRLKAGVIIHFHDIFYPFEYPEKWVMEENRSWNEIYFLQSFLMDNEKYEILFFNDYMAKIHGDRIDREIPRFSETPSGSFWLRKRSS